MNKPIVVGVDGSSHSAEAVRYAVDLAHRRRAPLTLVHVYENLFYGYGPLSVAGSYAIAAEQLREAGEKLLQTVETDVRQANPELDVSTVLREGMAASVLIDLSKQAGAIVVGARGVGGFADMLLGSVATQVSAHAHGPVLVVREPADPHGPILCAYDGSPAADAALAYAAAEALAQDRTLVVSNVYWPEAWGFGEAPAGDPTELARRHAEEMIADALELISEEHPGLRAETKLVHSMGPAYSLVEESANAALTVIGCRGRGGFAGLLLGSVSRTLVTHGQGPIAVIHADH